MKAMGDHWTANFHQSRGLSPMSPPEQKTAVAFDSKTDRMAIDNLIQMDSKQPTNPSPKIRMLQRAPLSPPISPFAQVIKPSEQILEKETRETQHQSTRDPQLFPFAESDLHAQIPLFASPLECQVSSTSRATTPTTHVSPNTPPKPTADEYRLVTEVFNKMSAPMTTSIAETFNRNPEAYLQRELSYLKLYHGRTPKAPKPQVAKPVPRPLAPAWAGIKKIRTPIVSMGSTREAMPKPQRVSRPPMRVLLLNEAGARSPSMAKKTPASPKAARPPRSDVEWAKIPDFCPPLSTLALPPYNNSVRCMEAKWPQGQPIDLSNDPDRHLLHPAELHLSSIVRLTCAQYLTSKRRIFAAKLEYVRSGKDFSKTHAQNATRIDVNKASKLFEQFNSVGWFDAKHFARWLQ